MNGGVDLNKGIMLKFQRLTFSESLLLICQILLVLVPAIMSYLNILKYLDEFIALSMLILLFRHGFSIKKNKNVRSILLLLGMMLVLGFVFNMTSGISRKLIPVCIDAFSMIKNHIIFIAMVFYIPNLKKERVLKALLPLAKIFVIISFICGCINLVIFTPWQYDVRFGIRSFQFFFHNPAALGQAMLICLAVFVPAKTNKIYNILAIAVIILTLRSGLLAIVFAYFVLSIIMKRSTKLKWHHIVILLIGVVLVAWNMIQEYFLSQSTLRYTLLYYGAVVCKRYFPWGAGFATYGSQMAYDYYSPLYYEFGFNRIWGLNAVYGGIVNDNYWPMVVAQLGIIGVIVNIILFIKEFKIVSNNSLKIENGRMAMLLFINMMISTTASANMTGVAGTIIYFMIGLLLSADSCYKVTSN